MDEEPPELGGVFDSSDHGPGPAAEAPWRGVPVPVLGRGLKDLFTQPRRAAGAKRSQPGAEVPKSVFSSAVDAQLRQLNVEGMDLAALRTLVSKLIWEFVHLAARVPRVGVPPAPPPQARPHTGPPPQSDTQQLFQERQSKAEKELQQLKQELQSHVATTQQTMRSQEKELCSALRSEYEPDLSSMQQRVGRLDVHARRNNLVIRTPTDCSQQQLLDRCSSALRSHAAPEALVSAAVRPMKSQSSEYKLWCLELHDGRTKHALFRHSSSFRQDHVYLDVAVCY